MTEPPVPEQDDLEAQDPQDEKSVLVNAAFELFRAESDDLSRKDAIKRLTDLIPGYTDRQYTSAWTKVRALFDNACRMVFRWATENPPGATFELPDKNRIFLNELTRVCGGFTEEQYAEALEYAFEKSIF